MMLVLLVILIICFLGGMPSFGYHSYGWGPSGIVGVILIVVLIWFVMGRG
jgi:hypothetical protein